MGPSHSGDDLTRDQHIPMWVVGYRRLRTDSTAIVGKKFQIGECASGTDKDDGEYPYDRFATPRTSREFAVIRIGQSADRVIPVAARSRNPERTPYLLGSNAEGVGTLSGTL